MAYREILTMTELSTITNTINKWLLDAAWAQDREVIEHALKHGCPAVAGVMSAACSSGNVAIVELLADAWAHHEGCAIGAHGIEDVLDKKDYNMFKCLMRRCLLSKVAVDIIAWRLGMK